MAQTRPHRMYAKARVLGFTRGKRNTTEHTSLIQIEGCTNPQSADFYLGKRIVYVYRCPSGVKTIWGKVTRSHGTSGVVRAKFAKNLPPKAFGASARVMLYPSRI